MIPQLPDKIPKELKYNLPQKLQEEANGSSKAFCVKKGGS